MARSEENASHPVRSVVLACIGFVLLGFVGWMYIPDSRLAMPLAACAVVPFGARSKSVRQGLLRGMGLGVLAGGSMFAALCQIGMGGSVIVPLSAGTQTQSAQTQVAGTSPVTSATSPAITVLEPETKALRAWTQQVAPRAAAITIGGTAVLCAGVGAFFAYLSAKRRRQLNRPWGS